MASTSTHISLLSHRQQRRWYVHVVSFWLVIEIWHVSQLAVYLSHSNCYCGQVVYVHIRRCHHAVSFDTRQQLVMLILSLTAYCWVLRLTHLCPDNSPVLGSALLSSPVSGEEAISSLSVVGNYQHWYSKQRLKMLLLIHPLDCDVWLFYASVNYYLLEAICVQAVRESEAASVIIVLTVCLTNRLWEFHQIFDLVQVRTQINWLDFEVKRSRESKCFFLVEPYSSAVWC